ncbi:hypothetical protein FSP39_003639 [Pinctada imbricata]|uniref:Tyrosinase copper-binding domain-containing protein n=1 Tax=Pinctada imbricata TaxID=66713 RepID=A0AA88XCP2_PINIB|nr:hypothetical protein FSP39_003639 [Pinctada imbricata]
MEQTAERIATTCFINYEWTVSGLRCHNVTKETMDLIERLLLPYLNKKRHRRQTSNGRNRVRKEYRKLSAGERHRFHRALNRLKSNGRYDEIASIHHSGIVARAAHGGPAFLPWHRLYLMILEDALREVEPDVTIPYWDINLDFNMQWRILSSVIWSSEFAGNGGTPVSTGPFADWGLRRNIGAETFERPFSNTDLANLFNMFGTTEFSIGLESLHNTAHVWVGGGMSFIDEAPRDPIFFLLHSYVDYIWWQWQMDNANNSATWRYPRNILNTLHAPNEPLFNLTIHGRSISNEEGYSRDWAFNYFSYERRPNCNDGTCTGPYLRCVEQNDQFSGQTSYCASVEQSVAMPNGQFNRKKRNTENNRDHTSLVKPFSTINHKRMKNFSCIEDSLGLDLSKSPIWSDRHPGLQVITGYPIQNSMRINCDHDYHLWAFLPIKVIHLRPYGNIFESYPVSNGVMDFKLDIYSDLLYRKYVNFTRPQNPPCLKPCIGDATGTSKVFIRAEGVNYYGKYNDYVIIDDRQPIDAKIGYIGIRRPDRKPTKVMITAHDQCGRICAPKCLKKGSSPPEYEPCTGVIKVDRNYPRFCSNSYGDAVLKYWSMADEVCPSEKQRSVYMVFYCDSKADWFPWPGAHKIKKK